MASNFPENSNYPNPKSEICTDELMDDFGDAKIVQNELMEGNSGDSSLGSHYDTDIEIIEYQELQQPSSDNPEKEPSEHEETESEQSAEESSQEPSLVMNAEQCATFQNPPADETLVKVDSNDCPTDPYASSSEYEEERKRSSQGCIHSIGDYALWIIHAAYWMLHSAIALFPHGRIPQFQEIVELVTALNRINPDLRNFKSFIEEWWYNKGNVEESFNYVEIHNEEAVEMESEEEKEWKRKQLEHELKMKALMEKLRVQRETADHAFAAQAENLNNQASNIQESFLKMQEDTKRDLDEEDRLRREEDARSLQRFNENLEEDHRRYEEEQARIQKELREKNDAEIRVLEKEREENAKIFEKHQNEYKIKTDRQNAEMAEAEERHKRNMAREKAEFEEKLRQIEEKLRQEEYESARKWRERQQEADRQFAQIMRILQFRAWNDAIERNWTNRLNFLRSANREVERVYGRLLAELKKFENQSHQNPNNNRRHIDLIHQYSNSLIQKIESERKMMAEEEANMKEMYRKTNKSFLLRIESAVVNVRKHCEAGIEVLKSLKSINRASIDNVENCFGSLRRASLDIPTLAMLKFQHSEDMRHQEEDRSNYDSTFTEQTVIIEEVE